MSQPLAQQELMPPAPRRRLIVPPGHVSHWGVDPSVGRVSIAYAASEGRRGARTASFANLEGGDRLDHIWAETSRFVWDLLACGGFPLPGVVVVEQPSGDRPNPSLSYAVGVIMGAIHHAIRHDYGRSVVVETCTSGWWKKTATGFGAHYKPTKKKLGRAPVFEDYGVARWAMANGYTGASWDEADALGIAVAAQREIVLEPR